MNRSLKDVPTAKKLVWNGSSPHSQDKLENPFGIASSFGLELNKFFLETSSENILDYFPEAVVLENLSNKEGIQLKEFSTVSL